MNDVQDLRRRRAELAAELDALTGRREHAFRANSDALARQRFGVTHHDEAAMLELAEGEVADDPAISALRRSIDAIDDELGRAHHGRLTGWLRR